jgi:riboflavin kinase/FMN adenylyltransferase
VYENSIATMESHLLDFMGDVYRENVRLFFLERVRDEQHFNSTTQLMTQINRDVQKTRDWFSDHPVSSLGLVLP